MDVVHSAGFTIVRMCIQIFKLKSTEGKRVQIFKPKSTEGWNKIVTIDIIKLKNG
jgi:hypothetical protein